MTKFPDLRADLISKFNVRSNLAIHRSDTPFVIRQPIRRLRLLERLYKPIRTVLGDGNTEAFEVFPPQVHLLLNPPSRRFDRFPFASLSEVIQLSLELSTAPLEIV